MPTTVGYILDTNIVIHLIRNDALGQQIDAKYHLDGTHISRIWIDPDSKTI